MSEKREIFKIQIALETNDHNAAALIHNEDRSITGTIEITRELEEIMDGRPKIFMYGDKIITPEGKPAMGWNEEAPWQEW